MLAGCAEERSASGELITFIPEASALILKSENPDLFFSNLKNNTFLRQNKSHPLQTHLKKQLSFLHHIPHTLSSYLCFTKTENRISYLFISQEVPQDVNLDSIPNRKVETLTADFGSIKKYTLEDQVTYSAIKDSILLISDSRSLLESSLKSDAANFSRDFEKALKAASETGPSIFINHERFNDVFKRFFPAADFIPVRNFSNWSVLDVEVESTSIKLNGITTAEDSLKIINLFKNVDPVRNAIADISPNTATGFYSITFRDFSVLQKNLKPGPTKITTSPENTLLQTASETGMIWMDPAPVFVVSSKEVEISGLSFAAERKVSEEFRDIPIYLYDDSGTFGDLLKPLLDPGSLKYFLITDRFLLFSEDPEALRKIITARQNENAFSNSEAYLAALENLSSEASILLVSNNSNFGDEISAYVSNEHAEATRKLSFKGYPIAAIQFIYQSDFAHIHAIVRKTEEISQENDVSQITRVSLNAALSVPPVLFENHRSKRRDIVAQDVQNTLYLISPEGSIYWKQDLKSRILGKVQQVDLFRNGRYQMAFATQNALHIIDRDGNPVKPFPLKFKDDVTKPLAVFDYDNKRQYRFVVVQNDRVYMYDSKGKSVKGFSFQKAGDEIVRTPKHIKIGKKDYILIPQADGKLNILSRTGKIRVLLREDLAFSENEWYEYEDAFVSTNSLGELVNKLDSRDWIAFER